MKTAQAGDALNSVDSIPSGVDPSQREGFHQLPPEMYEVGAPLPYQFDLGRRDFFKALGCGVLAILVAPALGQESGNRGRPGRGGQAAGDVAAWIHIGEDGTITVFNGKAEVGQNVKTSLAQAVAEELRAPMSMIKMVMADTQLVPYDAGTFGSQSTPQMAPRLHRVAATLREALVDLAAEHFKVDRGALTVADGRITKAGGGESVGFGQLTKGQKIVKQVDDKIAITAPADWKICGTSVPKLEGRDFVTGKHKYSSDVKLPGMLHAKVVRPTAFEATLVSADTKAAEEMSGVKVVRDGNFLGVVARDVLSAQHAANAIRAEWKAEPQPSSAELFDYLKKNAGAGGGGRGGGGGGGAGGGSIEDGLARAAEKLKQTYTVAYIAHTPLEPRAAVAEWKDDQLTVWTGTQRPFGVKSDLARALNVPEEKVRVIVPDTGSGYGGKHSGEAAIEAARLAKAAGKPVKLVWTRQEEFTWAYFRPAGVIEVSAGVKKDGTVTAWEFHNYNSGASSITTPYAVANKKTEFHGTKSPLKQGSYRALAATANTFARETAMDELADLVKMDPLEFRLKNLKEARMSAVLEAAAKQFGWGKTKSARERGFGIACGTEKGSFVATCAEVAIDSSGNIRVVRAVTAFECGAVVNPEHLKNQIEGAMVMGLGGALFEAISFENGMITNPHLADYRVPRFSDLPKLEVVLVNRKDIPSLGAGETPIIGIAPAVGNAIFAATQIRLRSMPMVPNGLKV
jgi:nicotinate dehydrogenase subunit B